MPPEDLPEEAVPGRSHGARANRRARLRRDRARQRKEANEAGLPRWEGLQPILGFFLFPALLALALLVTGGGWPKPVLYGFAGLIGLYVAVSTFRGVELVYACLLIYLPFSTSYVIPVAPGVNGTNMLMLLGLFASLLRMSERREGWIDWPPGTTLVAVFAVYSTFSGVTAAFQPDGFYHLIYGELLNYKAWIDQFLLYGIALSFIRDTETAKRMMVYMAIGSMVLVIYAVPEMLDKMGRATIEKSRLVGPQRQSNNFGGFVAYTLLPLAAFFLVFIRDWRVWALTPYFLIAAKILITTFSRGAYVAFAAGSLFAGYFKGRVFILVGGILVVAFLAAFPRFIPESVLVRLQSITEQAEPSRAAPEQLDKSSENRLILWRAAGKMMAEDPILGKGFKFFPKLKSQYTEQPVRESDPHNMYLYIGSQMGVPAMLLYLAIIARAFFLGRRLSRYREDRFIRAIGIGGSAATVCFSIICLFGSRAVNLEFTCYFWTLFVVMQVISRDLPVPDKGLMRKNAFTPDPGAVAPKRSRLPLQKTQRLGQGRQCASPPPTLPPAVPPAEPVEPARHLSRQRVIANWGLKSDSDASPDAAPDAAQNAAADTRPAGASPSDPDASANAGIDAGDSVSRNATTRRTRRKLRGLVTVPATRAGKRSL